MKLRISSSLRNAINLKGSLTFCFQRCNISSSSNFFHPISRFFHRMRSFVRPMASQGSHVLERGCSVCLHVRLTLTVAGGVCSPMQWPHVTQRAVYHTDTPDVFGTTTIKITDGEKTESPFHATIHLHETTCNSARSTYHLNAELPEKPWSASHINGNPAFGSTVYLG